MKVSVLVFVSEEQPLEQIQASAQQLLERATEGAGEYRPWFEALDIEWHAISAAEVSAPEANINPYFKAVQARLPATSGAWVAVLDPHTPGSIEQLPQLLLKKFRSKDCETTAIISEQKLSFKQSLPRLAERAVFFLGGRRSPPPEHGTSILFDSRWVSALVALPHTSEWNLPLGLGVVRAQWECIKHHHSPVVQPSARNGSGFKMRARRLLLAGGLFELGLLAAVLCYTLGGALAIMGSEQRWALHAALGMVIGCVFILSAAIIQWLSRRSLKPALKQALEIRETIERENRLRLEPRVVPASAIESR